MQFGEESGTTCQRRSTESQMNSLRAFCFTVSHIVGLPVFCFFVGVVFGWGGFLLMKLLLEQNDVSLISQKEKFSVENLVCLFSVRSFFPNFSNKQKQALMSCGDMSLGCVMSFRCIHFPLMSFQMHSTCPLRSLDYMYISEFYISSVGGWGGSPLRSALWVFLSNGALMDRGNQRVERRVASTFQFLTFRQLLFVFTELLCELQYRLDTGDNLSISESSSDESDVEVLESKSDSDLEIAMDEPDDILEDYNDELVSGLFHTEDVTPDLDLSPRILEDAELEQASHVDSDRGQLEGDDAKSQASKLGASAKSKPSPQPSSVQFDSNINVSHAFNSSEPIRVQHFWENGFWANVFTDEGPMQSKSTKRFETSSRSCNHWCSC